MNIQDIPLGASFWRVYPNKNTRPDDDGELIKIGNTQYIPKEGDRSFNLGISSMISLTPRRRAFKDLALGERFTYDHVEYLKTKPTVNERHNAVRCETEFFNDDHMVECKRS